MKQIFSDMSRLHGPKRQHVIDLSEPVACLHQDSFHARAVGKLYIVATVAYDVRVREIDVHAPARLLYEAHLRLPAIALNRVFGEGAVGVVRAEENAVHSCPILPEMVFHEIMDFVNQIDGEVAASHPRLIGHHDHMKPVMIQQPDSFHHARENNETAQVVDITHLLVNGTIPV